MPRPTWLKVHPTRINAFASPQTGPIGGSGRGPIVPLSLPVRDAIDAAQPSSASRAAKLRQGRSGPVALFWMALDETGR